MKAFRVVFPIALVLIAAFGCRWSRTSNTSTSVTPTAASPEVSTLDNEAIAAVKDFWEQHTTKCGDSYYSSEDFRGIITIHEYKNVSFSARRTGPTTEADRFNGIEWNGNVEILTKLYRDNHEGTWSNWKERTTGGGYQIRATKRQSGWSVTQLLHITQQRKINCSDIPA
jgi:hypothetical protein